MARPIGAPELRPVPALARIWSQGGHRYHEEDGDGSAVVYVAY